MDNMTNNHKQQLEGLLTKREEEILLLLAKGYTTKEIACSLFISYETAKRHIRNVYHKLGTHNKIEALRKAGLL